MLLFNGLILIAQFRESLSESFNLQFSFIGRVCRDCDFAVYTELLLQAILGDGSFNELVFGFHQSIFQLLDFGLGSLALNVGIGYLGEEFGFGWHT